MTFTCSKHVLKYWHPSLGFLAAFKRISKCLMLSGQASVPYTFQHKMNCFAKMWGGLQVFPNILLKSLMHAVILMYGWLSEMPVIASHCSSVPNQLLQQARNWLQSKHRPSLIVPNQVQSSPLRPGEPSQEEPD